MEDWERSRRRAMPGGAARRDELEKGPSGRTLCRWCRLEVPPPRRTFCSDYCVHQWRLRSDPGYLRQCLFARDRGICALCRADTAAAWIWIQRLRGGKRALALREWGLKTLSRKSLWDADHIVPVADGGGECDLANMRTLCLKCHRKVTLEWRAARARTGLTSSGAGA
jgi:5-methylcytosine-specific restriction endonuclease McrA